MDALTLPRLRARLRMPGLTRRLSAEMQRGGTSGRDAAERLGRSDAPRPEGPLVWCHLPDGLEISALASLRARLDDEFGGITLLATAPDAGRRRRPGEAAGLVCQVPPLDAPAIGLRFLAHWAPDAAIWFGRVDAPLLLEAAARRGVPLFLQNAVSPEGGAGRTRALERRLLGLFDRIFALNPSEHELIRSIGAIPSRIEVTGRLASIAHPPPCIEAEREVLAAALRGRPVWLAACPDPDEIPAILAAHTTARRTAHRLLLLLMPRLEAEGPALAERLRAEGWNVARRDSDEEPDEATDIFLGDCRDELGLFYRLAPVSFLGGTLTDTEVPPAVDPATLGSAVVAGPYSGSEAETLRRLRRGGACRLVADGDRLGPAVAELLAPDRAALLALNAWDITSDGSHVLDRLAHFVTVALRERAR